VSNEQQPIARQTEIIFHNLLFTIVVLELFGLAFLMIKLLLVPLYHKIYSHQQYLSKKNRAGVSSDNLAMVVVEKTNRPTIRKSVPSIKSRRRWSTTSAPISDTHE
jgi:hypothetical protein